MITLHKILLGTGAAAALVATGGGVAYYEWTHSPTYSLRSAANAVVHHDRYEFEKYVDIDTLLQSGMSDMTDGNALASAMGSAMATALKSQFIKAIEEGTVSTSSQIGHGFDDTLHGHLPDIEREGRNAYFKVPVTTSGGAPFTIRVHMTQVPDGYWRVDRLANIKDLREVEAAEEKAKKAANVKANNEKVAKLRVVARLHTSLSADWEQKNRFQIKFENDAPVQVIGFKGHIRLPAHGFDQSIRAELVIGSGQSQVGVWEFAANRYIADTARVFALGETSDFEVEVDSVSFVDGTKAVRDSDEL